jgi:S-adenosylmethionine hydrolase
MKGTPHGMVETGEESKPNTQKIEVWAQDIKGIIYYIDKFGNVYQAEDIVANKSNPIVIAKYVKNGDVFSIPAFGI